MSNLPGLFGILNITTDSFLDGGEYVDADKAFEQALALHAGGADIIDIGPASSHPDSTPVSAQTEIERLTTLVPALQANNIPVSIDSYQTQTQRWALQNNVDWMNDIHGFADPDLYSDLATSDCRLVVMHAIQSAGAATRTSPPPSAHASCPSPMAAPALSCGATTLPVLFTHHQLHFPPSF